MVNFEKRENVDIITFSIHKIDALVADEIRDKIIRLFDNANTRVVIDLSGIEYIDSSGFGCFLSIFKAAKHNYGVVKFTNAEARIRILFETLNLHTVFDIYNDSDSCIKSFRSF
jgi:anti-sigma B factor antagonist